MGRTEFLTWKPITSEPWLAKQSKSNTFNESEMALFYEPTVQYAQKAFDVADIVREAIFASLRDCL
jgi:hypothetical protein